MKLVIVDEEFDPNKGYLEYYLARELTKLGHKVYVFTFGKVKRASSTRLKEGFDVVGIPHVAVIRGVHIPFPSEVRNITRFIKAEKPDVIHCQLLYSPLSLIFLMLKNVFGYKTVGSILTQMNEVFLPWNTRGKLLFYLSKIVAKHYAERKSEMLFAKSTELMKLILRRYELLSSKFCVVSLGADPKLFKFDAKKRISLRRRLGLRENDIVIVYSGKIDPSKGLDVLIGAISPIMAKNSKVKLLIVGEGESSYLKYLKNLISNSGISERVIFHPWVNRTLLPSYYSASDIGVWPGLSSISIVEAASVSLPLIIARYPVEIYAIQNENGFAFEIGNLDELRKYLEILIYDSRLRKEMGRKSRLLVERKLNWRNIAIQYTKAYQRVLDEHIHHELEVRK